MVTPKKSVPRGQQRVAQSVKLAKKVSAAGISASAIASAQHESENGWQLNEFEHAMIMAYNAYSRWMMHCMASIGYNDFNPLDILVLHNVNHRSREKRLSDIAFILNIDDTHTVNYSLKKLMKTDLVKGVKVGKEMYYSTNDKGKEVCQRYQEVRQSCLVSPALATDRNLEEVSHSGLILRTLAGLYDQASRAASVF